MEINAQRSRIFSKYTLINNEEIDVESIEITLREAFKLASTLRRLHHYLQNTSAETVYVIRESKMPINANDINEYNPDEIDLLFVCDYATAAYAVDHIKVEIPKIFELAQGMVYIQAKIIYDILSEICIMRLSVNDICGILIGGAV